MRRIASASALVLLICFGCSAADDCPQDQPPGVPRPVRLTQGDKLWVCLYGTPPSPPQPPSFWRMVVDLLKWPTVAKPPFGRSVAFLAGVSQYNDRSFEQLDFVKNDLTDFRNFLLTQGGFDAVYEARDQNVTEELVNKFMRGHFANPSDGYLTAEDRLLFYFSGHGGQQSGVPYLLFGTAIKDDYTQGALPARAVYEWASVIPAKHLLIILDSCFSGLVPQMKGAPRFNSSALARALSGDASGLLLTAGTGDEAAYAAEIAKNRHGSVFTHALIDAFGSTAPNQPMVAIEEIFGRAKEALASFNATEQRRMTPSWMFLPRSGALRSGDFIFINPRATKTEAPQALYAGPPVRKDGDSELRYTNAVERAEEPGGLIVGKLTPATAKPFVSRAADEAKEILSCEVKNPYATPCSEAVARVGRILVDLALYDASFSALYTWVNETRSKDTVSSRDTSNGYELLLSLAKQLNEFAESQKPVTESPVNDIQCRYKSAYQKAKKVYVRLAACDSDHYICNDEYELSEAAELRESFRALPSAASDTQRLDDAVKLLEKRGMTNAQKQSIVDVVGQIMSQLLPQFQGVPDSSCKGQ
jgi:hypothetical protein